MPKKKKPEPPKPDNYFVWVVAYINSDYLERVYSDLAKYPEYSEIEAFIPTIRVLKKTFKGKQHFEDVPLLFNYGFFKIPRKYAVHASFLDSMKSHISCIFSWVKDPLKAMSRSYRGAHDISYATATEQEIGILLKDSFNYSAHDASEISQVKIGSIITLRGYPWEGIQAELVEILENKKQVKVKIAIFDQQREITVSFDNVFFTMYRKENHDDSLSITQSLDAMADNHKLDKVMFKNQQK